MTQVTRWCARITTSRLFEVLIIIVIGANAIVLGLETYPHLGDRRPLYGLTSSTSW
jgi:voltage-gated sodium channel